MKLELNAFSQYLKAPSIRQFSSKISQMTDVVNLTVGQPDFPMPSSVKTAYQQAIADNQTTYSHNKGLLETREAVSRYYKTRFNIDYDPESIIITNGASEALDTSLRCIINPGDEILLPGPVYAGYIPLIQSLGGVPVFIDTRDTGLKITPELIKQHVSGRTRAIILNYPSNPTGMTLSEAEVAALVDLLKTLPIFVISDEIYAENTFNGTHTSFARFPEIHDQLLLINGLSKSHSATGVRIGFLSGPQYLIDKLTYMHAYNCICANVPSQVATITALTEAIDAPKAMNEAYVERRDYLVSELTDMGFSLTAVPQGAFYIFPNIQKFTDDDMQFCVDLLEQAHVATVPGSAFTDCGRGHIRISYAYDMTQLQEGMRRLRAFLETNYPTQ
ncbi:N-acetyl-L,L-diaminopimelate aminotransferase [Staphylococcus microti]|uniref:N-acetyl-L,L-diaminopimelate aminotransferase n=1 Tax=Staphylococcus microti TaxID=569857 RepID=A0A0D6XQC0_9STAP|nr:aminotransferase class I/II-fold pyridoxal phosphate-dependent enzyme [Staphylococcus microti]KIX90063.1 N-acetyl-L,L-diaminopimelate aminotransferase [Staphylococcus microti]PNZ79976.1 aminotransferase class V-fold PLP-dependent enzyme [Staphylococcus microti]SUM57081.1 putative aminotransferase [Staphylococcus microti]